MSLQKKKKNKTKQRNFLAENEIWNLPVVQYDTARHREQRFVVFCPQSSQPGSFIRLPKSRILRGQSGRTKEVCQEVMVIVALSSSLSS